MTPPDKDQATQFAIMLSSGMPAGEAILYFLPPQPHPQVFEEALRVWTTAETTKRAILAIQGKAWQDLDIEERCKLAIDKHYSEMAYFLYSRNYIELVGAEKQKADTCRQALEAKLAGMAGKMDALTRFWADVSGGKIKLTATPSLAAIPSA